nr:uncharacterized protein LOC110363002 isoform X4 [Columba livia]
MRNPYVTERDILEQKQLFESLMQSTAMICAEFPLEEQPDTMEALLTAGFYCHHVTDKSTVPRPPALPVTIARASEHPFYAAPQHCGVKTQDLLSRQTCHHHLPARATVPSRSQLPSPSYSFTLLSMPRAGGHELLMELGISTPQLPAFDALKRDTNRAMLVLEVPQMILPAVWPWSALATSSHMLHSPGPWAPPGF